MFEGGYLVVPAGLEELPAGAGLGAVLEGLDPARVSPADTVRLVAAAHRQLAHQQAWFHACAREAALADPTVPGGRAERDVPAAGDELRVVLAASRTAVARMLDLADAAERHPRLGQRWRAGWLDEQRVAILVRWTAALSEEHAAAVIDELVDQAAGLTLSRLIDRVQALAKALDPGWAEKVYRQARRQRRVRARCTEAGTVNLSALDLPLAAGVRSVRRVNALAARAQAAGHPGLIDTVRADVLCALMHPDAEGATDAEIVAAAIAAAQPDDPTPRHTPDPADAPPDVPAPDDPAPDGPAPDDDDAQTADSEAGGSPAEDSPAEAPDDDCAGGASQGSEDAAGGSPAGNGVVVGRRATRQERVELRVGLGTLLELDDRPARLPGWGVIPAGTARELAAGYATTAAEWRVAVTDSTGALSAALVTRHRPTDHLAVSVPVEPSVPGAPRPVIELHTSEALLDRLRPAEHPGWARLITDLHHQLALWRTARTEDHAAHHAEQAAERAGQDAEHRAAQHAAYSAAPPAGGTSSGAPPDTGLAPDALDADGWSRVAARRRERARETWARFPSAALRRWITMRDRSCVFPPCGASALAAEIDHTRAVVDHGLTTAPNLGPVCGHDHDLKDQGWTLAQPRPGWFAWTSPTGHTYSRPPQPVGEDLPDPRPPTMPSSTEPDRYADNGPAWDGRPPKPRPPETRSPPGAPPPDDPDPPF